jgi:hypothetical protein
MVNAGIEWPQPVLDMESATDLMQLAATGLQHRSDARAGLCENLFADFRREKSRDEPIVDVDQRGRPRY